MQRTIRYIYRTRKLFINKGFTGFIKVKLQLVRHIPRISENSKNS